jgi:nucleoid-associated protein
LEHASKGSGRHWNTEEMAFKLNYAVIHSFEKQQHNSLIDPEKIVKKPLLNAESSGIIKLVSSIHSLLGKTGNNVIWGQFSENGRQGRFPKLTNDIIDSNSKENFQTLSHIALDEIIDQAREEALSTGGFFLFAQYEQNAVSYLLVTSIKQKDGLRLDPKSYDPVETTDIDMSKVQQAARINLARLSEALTPEESEINVSEESTEDANFESDKTYLCFISKGNRSEPSGYFIKALGCERGVPSRRATQNAIDMIVRFFKNKPDIKAYRVQARENVVRYLQKKLEEGRHATLDGICAAADKAIPTEHADLGSHLDELKTFLNNEENRVPEEFSVNKSALNEKIRIKGESGNHWSIQFEKGSLGTDENSKVCYSKERSKIILSDPSPALCRLIEKAIADDTAE